MRSAYFRSILKQDIQWHDEKGAHDLTSQMTEYDNSTTKKLSERPIQVKCNEMISH